MYEPHFQRTDALIATIGRIEAARAKRQVRNYVEVSDYIDSCVLAGSDEA